MAVRLWAHACGTRRPTGLAQTPLPQRRL